MTNDDDDAAWVVALPLPLLHLVEAAITWRDADQAYTDAPDDGLAEDNFEHAEIALRAAINAFDVTYATPVHAPVDADLDDKPYN